jgi:predicted acetyltransferase
MMIARLESIEELFPIFREYLERMCPFYTVHNFDAWCEGGVKRLQASSMTKNQQIYVLKKSEAIVGFAQVNQHLRFNRDGWAMAEFYIQKKYGQSGQGRRLAEYVFDRYPGPWEVAVALKNKNALLFWRQVISSYTRGQFMEQTADSFKGTGFLFHNTP